MPPADAAATCMRSVVVEGADFGPAPVTFGPALVARLLGAGDLIVALPQPQPLSLTGAAARLRSAVGGGPSVGSGAGAGAPHGIAYENDGSVTIAYNGSYGVLHRRGAGTEAARALRTAQYLCGCFGLLLLFFAFNVDKSVEETVATLKDFAINFASDILAVASILLVAELIDRVRSPTRREGGWGGTTEASFRHAASMRRWHERRCAEDEEGAPLQQRESSQLLGVSADAAGIGAPSQRSRGGLGAVGVMGPSAFTSESSGPSSRTASAVASRVPLFGPAASGQSTTGVAMGSPHHFPLPQHEEPPTFYTRPMSMAGGFE